MDDSIAALSIHLSDDLMEAYVNIPHILTDVTYTSEYLNTLLTQYGVVHGIDHVQIAQLVADPERFAGEAVLVARGTMPVNGTDGKLEMVYVDTKVDDQLAKEKMAVNLREVRKLNNVSKGQLLAEIIPATEGEDGVNVNGKVLAAVDGKPYRLKPGRHTVVTIDGTRLYAAMDGMVAVGSGNRIHVYPVYEVNGDVDYHIGNIDFAGTVVIRGNVLPGFEVKAAGDIRVTGTVEGATMCAEGSIEIAGGVAGHNKAIIKAGLHVRSLFLQSAHVEAGGNVEVSQSIMHSTVRASQKVLCERNNGLIVGGLTQAGEMIKARTVGNTNSTVTVLEVGVLPDIRSEWTELQRSFKHVTDNLEKANKALAILNEQYAAGQLNELKLDLRQKLLQAKERAEQEQNEIEARLSELDDILNEAAASTAEVEWTIYPGTKLVMGKNTRYIQDAIRRVKFELVNGEIVTHSSF